MRRAPTPEQTVAIQTRAPEVLVEAGAGTGKTGVLVDRYCELLLLDRLEPDEVLAFTFTERAAAQLRERIRFELERRMREAGPGETAERIRVVLDGLGAAPITTIHGFCRRLLASHPVAAGIDPSFRVLEDAESQRLAQGAFGEALEEFLGDDDEERETTVAAYGIDGLRGAVIAAHEELRSSGQAEPRLPPAPETDLLGALAALEEAAAAAIAEDGCRGDHREKMEAARALAAARAERVPSVDELLRLVFTSKNPLRRDYLEALGAATAAVGEQEGGRQAYAHISELVRSFGARYAEAKEERSGLDFEDLQLSAVRLLRAELRGQGGLRRALQASARRRVPGHQRAAARADRGPARARGQRLLTSATSSSRSTGSATPTSRCSAASASVSPRCRRTRCSP